VFEFLPPKPTVIEQFVAKYSSGPLRTTGMVAAGIALIIVGFFLFQQFQLYRLRSQWKQMSAKVTELQTISAQIQEYRPWYDDSFRSLAILRVLSLAFPEEGVVTAKAIEIRDDGTVNCSGTARTYADLLEMLGNLRAAKGVSGVNVDSTRGKAPMQFTFDFQYGGAQ